MIRRVTVVLTTTAVASALLQVAPTTASGPAVVTPLLRTVALGADAVVALRGERMLGVSWRSGNPTVTLRWHTATGWSAWDEADHDTDAVGIPGTEPQWRPRGADRAQIRTSGAPVDLRLVRVADGVARPAIGFGSTAQAATLTGRQVLGAVHPRADWGADESLRRRAPSYSSTVRAVVVHHTAGLNGYARADVPAIIRADYAYHVKARGWADLGYNLVIDQYGGVWEGRYGGLGRATIGTHAQGFNTGTLGVSMIGDMTRTDASREAERAFAQVIGYGARTWGFDPSGSVTLTSGGSPRYRSGQRVTLPRVFDHGFTGHTACAGSLHDRLPALRTLAKIAMGPAPTIAAATLSGAPVHVPKPLVLATSLSLPAGWTVDLTDPQGTSIVASARGTGAKVRIEWDGLIAGLPAPPGTYYWTVKADDGFHDVVKRQGTFEVGLPLLDI